MGVGRERGAPELANEPGEVGRRGEVGAQRQGIDEAADQPLDLQPLAVGDRRADHQVVLAGEAVEQHVEGG